MYGLPDGSVGKNPPANAGDTEMQVQSPGWEDPMEKEAVTHCSTLAWEIPWTEEHGRLQSMEPQRVRHNLSTNTHTHTHTLISSIVLMGPHVLTSISYSMVGRKKPAERRFPQIMRKEGSMGSGDSACPTKLISFFIQNFSWRRSERRASTLCQALHLAVDTHFLLQSPQ